MAKQTVSIGASANDGTGDKHRVAFNKINQNFDELYDEPIPTLQEILDNNHDLVDGNNFQGTGAGAGNVGLYVNAFGDDAAKNNQGNVVNAFNAGAAENNTGESVNAFGNQAGLDNIYNYVNLLGLSATADENGQTVFSKEGSIMARLSTLLLTATRKWMFPDKDGTFAMLDDIGGAGLITITQAELTTLIADDLLVIGTTYKVMGVDAGWCNVYLKAVATNALEPKGTGEFINADWSNPIWTRYMLGTMTVTSGTFVSGEVVSGDNGTEAIYYTEGFLKWHDGDFSGVTSIIGETSGATANVSGFVSPSYNIGDVVVWGNKHWENLDGGIGNNNGEFALGESFQWLEVTDGMITEYDIVEYDVTNNLIINRKDKRGNDISTSKAYMVANGMVINPLKFFKWGHSDVKLNVHSDSRIEICNLIGLNYTSNVGHGFLVHDIIGNNNNLDTITGNGNYLSSITGNGNSLSNITGNGNSLSNITGNGNGLYSITGNNNSFNNITGNYNSLQNITGNIQIQNQTLMAKTIQGCNALGVSISDDISGATIIFGEYAKNIFTREDGELRISYYDNNNELKVKLITD